MVLFNHSTREMTAKIAYYGPGLCGKTTNLRVLHDKLDQATTGRLLSLSTAQDRTIYFDLLPVELGNVKGYTVRFQLCTVPGQVFYNETRKLVLKGVDGIVFVVDSQWSMLSHNLESFQNLRDNMTALNQSIDETAVVIQFNKRDLPGVLSVQALQESLGFQGFPFVEAVAADGRGVVETFRLVSKLTFVHLLKRLQRSPDAERLGPDWIASRHSTSPASAGIPAVGAELFALTSTVGPAPPPPTETPFDTTASWPRQVKGEVFGDATIPPLPAGPPEPTTEVLPLIPPEEPFPTAPAARDEDDTLTEPPPPSPFDELEPPLAAAPAAGEEPEAFPELPLGPTDEPEPEPAPQPRLAMEPPPPPPPQTPEPAPEPRAPEPRAPEPPPPPPNAAGWAEAFAGLSSRLDEQARSRAEESARFEALARETREAMAKVPATVGEELGSLAPAAAVTALRDALDAHTAEVRPKLLGLLEEMGRQRDAAFERERAQDDAARDSARRHREELRGDVERAAATILERVEALDGRLADLRGSLEQRLASLEASVSRLDAGDRLEELRRETTEVRRLVETKLEEAGGQGRRLNAFLRRALDELEPGEKG